MKLNKRVKRTFIHNKATYIGMILLIILSTSCFLGLITATSSVDKNVQRNRVEANVEDINFAYSKDLTEADMENLEKSFNLQMQKNCQVEYDYNQATLRIRPEFAEINKAKLYEGEYLAKKDEIMVDRFFFDAQKLSFSDKLKIGGRDYTISGTFTTPDYLTLQKAKTDFMADGAKFGLCLVSENTYQSLKNEKETISYSVVLHEKNQDALRKELAESGIVSEWTEKDTNSRITQFDGEIDAQKAISQIAPLFVLLVSSLIMAVVLNRMLKKEYIYVGTLSALGYRKREIFFHYLLLPVAISVVGSVIGIILGVFLAKPFVMISTAEYNIPKTELIFNWNDIVFILILPIVLNVIAAFVAIYRSLHINIVSLLKANAGKQKKGILTKLIPHKKGPFIIRFKLKEIMSNLPRSLLMLVGIAASSMFILTGFIFNGAISFLFDSNFHEKFGYDYQYILSEPLSENKTNGESYMVASFDYLTEDKTCNLIMNGVAEDSKYIKLYDEDGNRIAQDKTVITKSVANRLALKKGDVIKVKNNSNLKDYEITIDDICDIAYSSNVYMPLTQLNQMLDLPETTHVGYYSNEKLDIDEKFVADIQTLEDSKAGITSALSAMKSFLYLLAFVSAVIGIVVISIVTIMLIEENRKNISMLKVVGYHNKEISKLLLNSTSLLVWLGFFIGVPISTCLIQLFFDSITKDMFFYFRTELKIWQVIISLVFILLIYYLTLFMSKKKVMKVNMAESLKARE